MELKSTLMGEDYSNEYKIVQGQSFQDEYNEKLDSGTIILSHVGKIENLKPYDDVFIYSGDFKGYNNYEDEYYRLSSGTVIDGDNISFIFYDSSERIKNAVSVDDVYIKITTYDPATGDIADYEDMYSYDIENSVLTPTTNEFAPTINFTEHSDIYLASVKFENVRSAVFDDLRILVPTVPVEKPTFYKHLLVDQFGETRLSLTKDVYEYTIQLFSETKYLETVILPNISITQPLNFDKKKTIYDYIVQYVDMYSPYVKVAVTNSDKWVYRKKYTIDSSLEDIFSNVFSPNFSLTTPNLKELLQQLFIVKDMIPYVKDGVIKALDITERHGTFNTFGTNFIKESRSSDNHVDNLRREYNNALSQDSSTRMVELLGFRNSDNALMTLGNMRLEARFPIRKINKVLMCYYKKMRVASIDGSSRDRFIQFLCKQDITPLVKLNSERNLLSKDYYALATDKTAPTSIEELAQYKIATIGYDIGSKYISGWGTTYSYPDNLIWSNARSYIQNIAENVDLWKPFGIYNYGYLTRKIKNSEAIVIPTLKSSFISNFICPPFNSGDFGDDSTGKFKGFVFEVDYQSFYNGAIVHSKDNTKGDITNADNSSASLTLLEKDGLFEKEKANRFGNKTIVIPARYKTKGKTIEEVMDMLQPLGSVYEDDNIIFHREYSMYNNVIDCTYYAVKDYVLKNYYTSVFAKLRTYNLMSYADSVRRAENKKMFLLMSKDEAYYESENMAFNFSNFNSEFPLENIASCFVASPKAISIDYFEYPNKINYGYISYTYNDVTSNYACDTNAFVSGTSLCFNLSMYDNFSAGIYISQASPDVTISDVSKDVIGSTQAWYSLVDDYETGFTSELGFHVCHKEQDGIYDDATLYTQDEVSSGDNEDDVTSAYEKLNALPKIDFTDENTNVIGKVYNINKDNAEQIDMTFQIEPITTNNDILFTQWFMKLSDILSTNNKVSIDYDQVDTKEYSTKFEMFVSSFVVSTGYALRQSLPWFNIKISPASLANITKESNITNINYLYSSLPSDIRYKYNYQTQKIISADTSSIVISGKQTITVTTYNLGIPYVKPYVNENVQITLYRSLKTDGSSGTEYYFYSNLNIPADETLSEPYDGNEIQYTPSGSLFGPHTINEDSGFSNLKNYIANSGEILNAENSFIYELGAETNNLNITKTYEQNMFVATSDTAMSKTIVYDEYKKGSLPGISSLPVADTNEGGTEVLGVFHFKVDDMNINYIEVDLSRFSNTVRSVQYWYLVEEESTYKFVFGVNVTEEDIELGYVRINLSLLSSRSTKVIDNNHIAKGTIYNYTKDNNTKTYGEDQYYENN